MSDDIVLKIDGLVEQPLHLTFADLESIPEEAQVADVSRYHPNRQGDGVTLAALLERAGARPQANYVTLHAEQDDFHVSVPLAPLYDQGLVVYKLGPNRLGPERGGPIRFLIRDTALCHSSELDECANVKYLSRIELTERRGRDTRPASETEHAALHQAQGQSHDIISILSMRSKSSFQ
jgi:DMSO/TMAO reductase YedYZ molybdopterin-dependent catalytic subunit